MRTCTLSVAATDPNAAALGVEPWVSYEVTAAAMCKKKQGAKGARGRKQPHCHRTAAVILPVSKVSAGLYQATATGLPYHETHHLHRRCHERRRPARQARVPLRRR